MANIMLHQPMTIVLMKGGHSYRTLIPVDKLHASAEKNKFILIDGEMVNTFEIKRAFPHKANGLDAFIYSQSKEIREQIQTREKQKKERLGKGFKNVAEIIKRLEAENIAYNDV